jgi:hypothetical protein
MATKRPAKISTTKKPIYARVDPATGKLMTAIKVLRRTGGNGMHWVLLEEFQGREADVAKLVPIR